jgi:uncharacterized protein (DUF2236 family)
MGLTASDSSYLQTSPSSFEEFDELNMTFAASAVDRIDAVRSLESVELPPRPETNHSAFDPADVATVRRIFHEQGIELRLSIVNAFFSQIAMPAVASILHRSGAFDSDTMERFKDTRKFFVQIVEDPGSPAGLAAIEKVREVHRRAGVPPEIPEFQYVVYTLTHKFMETLKEFDASPPTRAEELAWFRVWRAVGGMLGAPDISENYDEFIAKNKLLEERKMVQSKVSHDLAEKIIENSLNFLPEPLRPLGRPIILSLIEPKVAEALGLQTSPEWQRSTVRCGLQTVSAISHVWHEFCDLIKMT